MSAQRDGYAQTPDAFFGSFILEYLIEHYDGYIQGLMDIEQTLDLSNEDFDLAMEWLEIFVYQELIPDDDRIH